MTEAVRSGTRIGWLSKAGRCSMRRIAHPTRTDKPIGVKIRGNTLAECSDTFVGPQKRKSRQIPPKTSVHQQVSPVVLYSARVFQSEQER